MRRGKRVVRVAVGEVIPLEAEFIFAEKHIERVKVDGVELDSTLEDKIVTYLYYEVPDGEEENRK